jgi:hypothetical protein
MIDFFDFLYSNIRDKNAVLHKLKFYSLLRVLVRNMANIILPLYFIVTKHAQQYKLSKSNEAKSQAKIIVSFTSFPLRIKKVWLVVECMLHQTYKPDMIILWLSKEQFNSIKVLPQRLLKLQKRGLTIRMVEGDLKSHKKYYYTIKEYQSDHIITIDDDIFYPTNMIKMLIDVHKKYPDSIISRRSLSITYDKSNGIKTYLDWKRCGNDTSISAFLFFTSGGGTFFPAKSFYRDVTNNTLFMALCQYADDIWLNAMIRLNKKNIVVISNQSSILPVIRKQQMALFDINVNKQDEQINNVMQHYVNTINMNPFIYKEGQTLDVIYDIDNG